MKIYNNRTGFNPKWALSTWIYRIARNSFIDCQRKTTKQPAACTDTLESLTDSELDHDTRMDVESAVSGLKPEDRELRKSKPASL